MATLHTAYYLSPIGLIQMISDDQFIQELRFTDEKEINFSSKTVDSPPLLKQCISQLDEFFKGERQTFTIPVNQNGTAFQQRVWNQLTAIPFGKTVSYLALAKQLGDAKAIRAVAASNGRNKISILVPCHRIVGSDQSLVGYAWGAWRKQWLLQHEARWANGVQTLF